MLTTSLELRLGPKLPAEKVSKAVAADDSAEDYDGPRNSADETIGGLALAR